MTQMELAALNHLKALGDAKKFCSDVTLLLVIPTEGAAGEMVYGLAMVWVHPYKARVSMIDDAANQLAQLASTGPNWPYALVWLNGDACHVPLPIEGHLSIMMEGNTSNAPCRRIHQLEVHQLLSSGSWVVYPEGLNGCQVLVIMSLPELLSSGMTLLEGKPTLLQMDLSQSSTKGQEFKGQSLGTGLSPPSAASLNRALPPKAEGQISMTMEVSKLLSRAVLDISGLASGSSTPKRPGPLALATTLPLKPENSAKPLDTSSQVSAPDDVEMDDPTLEEIHATPSPQVETPGPSSEAPSFNVTQLQEEANKALGCLLATRSSTDAHWRKQASDFGMSLCQNEFGTTKAIKEAKALCAHTIWDMETHCTALISKAKVWHAALIKEIEDDWTCTLAQVENTCSSAIWDAES